MKYKSSANSVRNRGDVLVALFVQLRQYVSIDEKPTKWQWGNLLRDDMCRDIKKKTTQQKIEHILVQLI